MEIIEISEIEKKQKIQVCLFVTSLTFFFFFFIENPFSG